MSSERALFAAAAAAYIPHPDDGRVLLVHHAKSNRWVLPGGKIEHDEPPKRGCEREAREEVGVNGIAGQLLTVCWLTAAAELWPGAATDNPYAYPCHMFTFHLPIDAADVDRIAVPAGEILAHHWWEPEEAAESGLMEQYNARNLLAATQVHRGERPTAYLESR
ncbi:NUDIX domain-containing protein [Streptacidiphilus pinicola]|uniref:NUDIX domain-containing protein n=1 Tax=Streptacidiphilus pinicola TaxID=2219663 RepID=UPI0014041B05|nr:NUDIX hydrolase [Streptacidiphilus pinicola]